MHTPDSASIIGAGTMGRRIAFGCVIRGVGVRIFDTDPVALEDAVDAVEQLVRERVADGRLSSEALDQSAQLLAPSDSLASCVADSPLVIQTVDERLELKREVFAKIDRYAPADALIVSNTSSLPASALAPATGRPANFLNFNFGPPDDLKVEIMGHSGTDPARVKQVVAFVARLGLVPIVASREI